MRSILTVAGLLGLLTVVGCQSTATDAGQPQQTTEGAPQQPDSLTTPSGGTVPGQSRV